MKRITKSFFMLALIGILLFAGSTKTYAAETGFVTKAGKTYYYKSSKTYAKDSILKVNGKYYYADKKGVIQKTGLTKVGSDTYYFDTKTGAAAIGPKKIGKTYYVFANNGKMYSNTYYANGKGQKFYLTKNGKALVGITTYKNASGKSCMSYFNGDGTIAISTFKTQGNNIYYFSTDGNVHKNGFRKINGKYYYADKNGKISHNGWQKISGKKYYFNKTTGAASVGVKKIGGAYYVFDSTGKMYTNTFWANSNGKKYYLGSDGKSKTGFYSSDKKGTKTYYLNGDGSYKKNQVFKVNGKTYYVSSAGQLSKKGYCKLKGKIYYFDEKTGAAVTGVRIGAFNGAEERCYYFDPSTSKGYRTGIVTDAKGDKYIFSKSNGAGYKRFYCDTNTKKMYYISPSTYKVKMSGTAKLGNISFEIKSDGSLNVKKACVIKKSDDDRTKLIKYGLSQLFKKDGGTGLPNTTSFDKINSYSCTEFVSKLYYEVGVDLGKSDIIGRCYEVGGKLYTKNTDYEIGDIMFWNLTNCDLKLDGHGEPWIIDHDGDGVCDRIHKKNEFGDGRTYHIHHVSIYLGNGQMMDASSGDGIIIHDITPDTDTYYVSAVMNILGK